MKKLVLFTICIILISCKKDENRWSEEEWQKWENEPLSEGYEISTRQETSAEFLSSKSTQFASEVILLQESFEKDHDLIRENFLSDSMSNESLKAFQATRGEVVDLAKEIGAIFNPDNFNCPIPDRILKKLVKKGGFIPPLVNIYIKRIDGDVIKYSRTGLSTFLHTVTVGDSSNWQSWPIMSAITALNGLNFADYLIGKDDGADNFMYNLDCSGYLNASVSGSGRLPFFQMAAKTESALNEQGSLFVAGGSLVSPIAVAYYGDIIGGIKMDTVTRIQILSQLLKIPQIKDTDMISFSNSYDMIFASNKGASSMNGSGKIEASASANSGSASFSANANAGGSLSRTSSFSGYDVFIGEQKPLPDSPPFSVKDLKNKIISLKKT